MIQPRILRWRELLPADGPYHIARHSRFAGSSPLHTHDFPELFWVEGGHATHELNGRHHDLRQGDVVVIRPADVHRFRGSSPGFTITNLAFPAEVDADLRGRYFPDGDFPWDRDEGARHQPVSPLGLARIREAAAAMAYGRPTRLHLDRLLLEVLTAIGRPAPATTVPLWLSAALEGWREDPTAMAAGVSGLADLAGRSREHVSRVLRRATGRKAIEVLNDLRMESAAARLRMSEDSIGAICHAVGLSNLGHFYRLFRRAFGTTPRRYRLDSQRTVDPR